VKLTIFVVFERFRYCVKIGVLIAKVPRFGGFDGVDGTQMAAVLALAV
jgi:hypothetical protein